ncbi:hypothetical protein TNIN_252021 [Trichonephila inaurata madagascariensis]|uniref:Uncharacterized protein n=1 Tax=Trichonephila inaurata madagascariensis TaxID=2747483 RepID=A0A8X7BT34_9ARAC|nr:hypothetical protein TNIN_252021 [Trichonephila inaurata madagascariensis]
MKKNPSSQTAQEIFRNGNDFIFCYCHPTDNRSTDRTSPTPNGMSHVSKREEKGTQSKCVNPSTNDDSVCIDAGNNDQRGSNETDTALAEEENIISERDLGSASHELVRRNKIREQSITMKQCNRKERWRRIFSGNA